MEYLGVDGCPDGWFWFGLNRSGENTFGVARDASELAVLGAGARLVLIDIPIGLHESGTAERRCDKEARRALGQPRGSSVFRSPVRQALEADDYADACARNFAISGKRMSQQGFQICRKIREIDRLLRDRAELRRTFREMHPEVAFWGLNNGKPTAHSKKRSAGRQERIEILSKYLPNAEAVFNEAKKLPRRLVGRDDILDAMVGAVTGRIGEGRLRALPEEPERDSLGLPMEMVYCTPSL